MNSPEYYRGVPAWLVRLPGVLAGVAFVVCTGMAVNAWWQMEAAAAENRRLRARLAEFNYLNPKGLTGVAIKRIPSPEGVWRYWVFMQERQKAKLRVTKDDIPKTEPGANIVVSLDFTAFDPDVNVLDMRIEKTANGSKFVVSFQSMFNEVPVSNEEAERWAKATETFVLDGAYAAKSGERIDFVRIREATPLELSKGIHIWMEFP